MMSFGKIRAWMLTHRKKLAVHCTIISGFVLYAFLCQGFPFAETSAVQGEARLHNIPLPSETTDIACGIDRFSIGTCTIDTEGWAFFENESKRTGTVYVVLHSLDNTYVFDSVSIVREDLTAGFIAVIPTGKIADGDYAVGIYLKTDQSEALEYTDQVFVKLPDTIGTTSVAP